MSDWVSEVWSFTFTTFVSAAAGVGAEKFFNISGRVIQPLWYNTFGRIHRRRRRAQDAKLIGGAETFAVGAARHQIYVRQFAPRGFSPDHLTARRVPDQPAHVLIEDLRQALRPGQAAELQEGIDARRLELDAAPEAWNAEKLALRRISVSRIGTDEEPTIDLGYAVTDYATFQVIANAWEKQSKNLAAEGQDLTAEDLRDILPGLSNSFGINLTIETADDDLLLTQRSAKASSAKNLRHISVNEGMAPADIDPRTDLPDPYLTALRGIEEELGIDLNDEPEIRKRITFHSLVCDVTRYEWALLGHVNLTQTKWTNATIQGARKLGAAPDDWETNELTFIPFNRKSLEDALGDDSNWVGHGYMNLLLSAMFRLRKDRSAFLEKARTVLMSDKRA
ncbi:hypothetical protein [Arthrobacter sp. CJ23]|uniref:hypothetical protein n=1 Tax=Arthrobacter sp. CJ23 TaxID=2972479 RepID=UPI00215C5825|nr:hypothetical protein [Arthrobacter sp. CJ23]UVJ39526.1 hypothetical protein NVV90_20400 [Arthrobacter sp. CJ23]